MTTVIYDTINVMDALSTLALVLRQLHLVHSLTASWIHIGFVVILYTFSAPATRYRGPSLIFGIVDTSVLLALTREGMTHVNKHGPTHQPPMIDDQLPATVAMTPYTASRQWEWREPQGDQWDHLAWCRGNALHKRKKKLTATHIKLEMCSLKKSQDITCTEGERTMLS